MRVVWHPPISNFCQLQLKPIDKTSQSEPWCTWLYWAKLQSISCKSLRIERFNIERFKGQILICTFITLNYISKQVQWICYRRNCKRERENTNKSSGKKNWFRFIICVNYFHLIFTWFSQHQTCVQKVRERNDSAHPKGNLMPSVFLMSSIRQNHINFLSQWTLMCFE